jgi:hypothetical protein
MPIAVLEEDVVADLLPGRLAGEVNEGEEVNAVEVVIEREQVDEEDGREQRDEKGGVGLEKR